MPVGLQVFASDGTTLQIDGEYVNYSIRKSGYISPDPNSSPESGVYWNHIDITGYNNPVVAVTAHGVGDCCSVEVIQPTGDFIGIYTNGRTYVRFTFESSNATIAYYIFDKWTPSSGNVGLQVFSDDGTQIFHSDWYTFKVSNFVPMSGYPPNETDSIHVGYTGSGTLATSKLFNRVLTLGSQGGAPATYKEGIWVEPSNGEIRSKYVFAGSYGSSSGWSFLQNTTNGVLVFDVSNVPIPYN